MVIDSDETMITCQSTCIFVPFGQQVAKLLPDKTNQNGWKAPWFQSEDFSNLMDCSEENTFSHRWRLRNNEELYWRDSVAVFSKDKNKYITLSVESPIRDAHWVDFKINSRYGKADELNVDATNDPDISCVSLITDSFFLSVDDTGMIYRSPMQFAIENCFTTRFGLLFDRKISDLDAGLPKLFSLSHPCDEALPVMSKDRYVSKTMRPLVTLHDPSILLSQSKKGNHMLWHIRKATITDLNVLSETMSVASKTVTPAKSRLSFPNPHHRVSTPTMCSMHSPAYMAAMFHRNNQSSAVSSPFSFLDSPIGSTSFAGEQSCSEPLEPEICLDLLWSEPNIGTCEAASKCFVTTDFTDDEYLCYLVPGQLRIIEFSETSYFKFGEFSVIPCLDAIQINNRCFFAVLENCGTLALFTGITRICKVHTPRVSCSPELLFASDPSTTEPVDTSAFDSLTTISTANVTSLVHPIENGFVMELRNSNRLVSVIVPSLSTTKSVSDSIDLLKYILPRDVAFSFLTKWYIARHSSSVSYNDEFKLFLSCLIDSIGLLTSQVDYFFISEDSALNSSADSIKRAKLENLTSESDFEYLLSSSLHASNASFFKDLFETTPALNSEEQQRFPTSNFNSSALLCNYILLVFNYFHSFLEELSLNVLNSSSHKHCLAFLYTIASELRLSQYIEYYRRKDPLFIKSLSGKIQLQLPISLLESLRKSPDWPDNQPFSIISHCHKILQKMECRPVMYVPGIFQRIGEVILLLGAVGHDANDWHHLPAQYLDVVKKAYSLRLASDFINFPDYPSMFIPSDEPESAHIAFLLTSFGVTAHSVNTYPPAIATIMSLLLQRCHAGIPRLNWPTKLIRLIGRPDLCRQVMEMNTVTSTSFPRMLGDDSDCEDETDECGLTETLEVLFPDDQRINEVRRLLQSHQPVRVFLPQTAGSSHHEHMEEYEQKLFQISQRTMALPVGRGMITLLTVSHSVADVNNIPILCLTGRIPPNNTAITLANYEDKPPNMDVWPQFHNGVAASLQLIRPDHLPSTGFSVNPGQAGFLLGLGLTGNLRKLAAYTIHAHLSRHHEYTTIALLLGLSAGRIGSSDTLITRVLSVHLAPLLPASATELDIPHSVQVAAIMAIGLLYQGTGQRHMSEVLLREIGRRPGPEMDNCTNRESYSLAAGIALGCVLLRRGPRLRGLDDLNLTSRLHLFVVGGSQLVPPNVCYQIKEGDTVNTNISGPGATLALGLIYWSTGSQEVAEWLAPPDTMANLDSVQPDFITLRCIARWLVLWDEILPSEEWINANLPEVLTIKDDEMIPTSLDNSDAVTMGQAYCAIVTGACYALGLKFAGTKNKAAYHTLLSLVHRFLKLRESSDVMNIVGRITLDTALNNMLLALSMIMAGTGNLMVLRVVRKLRARAQASYGDHMVVHMALGLLFLGGCRFTLRNDVDAIPILLASFYPLFPLTSTENRYHLQAFRHLYAIVVEPRLLLPRDVFSNNIVYALTEITLKECLHHSESTYTERAPCLLPDLKNIKSIKILGPRHHKIFIDVSRWHHKLKTLLDNGGGDIYTLLRPGQSQYAKDPIRYTATHIPEWKLADLELPYSSSTTTNNELCLYFQNFCKAVPFTPNLSICLELVQSLQSTVLVPLFSKLLSDLFLNEGKAFYEQNACVYYSEHLLLLKSFLRLYTFDEFLEKLLSILLLTIQNAIQKEISFTSLLAFLRNDPALSDRDLIMLTAFVAHCNLPLIVPLDESIRSPLEFIIGLKSNGVDDECLANFAHLFDDLN